MKKQSGIFVILLLLILVIIGSCGPGKRTVTRSTNLADIYNPSRKSLHPDFSVHHINDSNSVLYIRIFPSELLFTQANEQGDFLARMQIKYLVNEIGSDLKKAALIDSSSIIKTLNRDELRSSYFTAIPLKAAYGSMYSVEVNILDLQRRSVSKNFIIADKKSRFNSQNYRVLSPKTGYPTFTNTFNSEEYFRISHNKQGYDSIIVDYYNLDRTMPRPIFSNAPEMPFKTYPDSSWVMPWSDSSTYMLPYQGIYHFRFEEDVREGLSLFNFGENFPASKTPTDLLQPLVYLTSSSQFRDLRMEPNRKLAIDNYWLSVAGDMNAARELIRVYYNRVLFSNLFFTSYKEGWKTDRGMIYIIFGPPNILEKDVDMEKWIYFTKRNGAPVEFVFERNTNLFTYRDYKIRRNMASNSLWAEAVRVWNSGKIYSPEY